MAENPLHTKLCDLQGIVNQAIEILNERLPGEVQVRAQRTVKKPRQEEQRVTTSHAIRNTS